MRGRLEKISDLALAADAKCGVSGRIGENWMTCSKAIAEIRRICKESAAEEICPDYEWLARIMTGDHFEPECLAKAIEAEAAKRPIDYPTFYTPGWRCDLAKKLEGKAKLAPLEKICAKTPNTIVLQTKMTSGRCLSAEWEAESTSHGAQSYLYDGDKCVCQIRFFNTFQGRALGRCITTFALRGLASRCGSNSRKKANRRLRKAAAGEVK